MHTRHLRRGGITALVVGILLLLGAPIAALADEPASSASEETPPATEVTTPPTAPEEPPATVPPVEEPPVVEPPVEEPPVTAVPPDTAPDADVPSDSDASDRAAQVESALPAPVPLGAPDILGQIRQATLNPAHVGAMNPGFQTGLCPDNPFNDDTFGWHFVLPGVITTFVTLSATFQDAGTITQFLSFPTGKHAYVWTPGPDTLLGATATVEGLRTEFNLSHVCPGTTNPVGSLSVIKAIQGTPSGDPFTINVTCTLNQETVVDTDLVFNGAGQQQVGNIPAGATCNVEETDDGGATTVEYSADPPQNIVIVANQVAGPVTVTNIFGEEPEVGSLAVTKEIEGTPPVGAQFLVHVTCTLDTDTVVDQDLPLFTTDGQTETITGIPAGAECEVEETGNFGALVSYDPDPPVVTIVENEQSDVTVTNTYELGGLRVTKVVDGAGTPAPGTQFSVRVRCEFADVEVVDETLVFGVAGGEDSIDGIPAGATCDVTEPGTGGASGVTITPDSVVIVGESTQDVTVTNTFTSTSPTSVVPVTPATPSGVSASGSSGSSGSLAFTGSNGASLAATGLALLIGGGAALWFARRRSPFLSR